MQSIYLSLCDRTGNAAKPWKALGFHCVLVDLQHPSGWNMRDDGMLTYGGSVDDSAVESFIRANIGNIRFVSAFPPCTDLAVSGARWWAAKGQCRLDFALHLVHTCRRLIELAGCAGYIENPVGRLSTHWRKADYYFHPAEFAMLADDPDVEAYTKKTGLWAFGDFVMPPQDRYNVPAVLGSKMHLLPPSAERANLRSVTPVGFARAVASYNA